MINEATVIVAKDMDVVLVVVYASEKLECFLPPWCMAIDFNQFIKIKMIYDNLVREISDIDLALHAMTSGDTTSCKLNVEKVHIQNSWRCLYKMLVLNITLIEKLSKRQNNICLNYEVWQKFKQKLFIHKIQIQIYLLN